jgi:hypothetical protein
MQDDEELIRYLISVGEAVEYGEPWTETTTHEWWWCANNADGRHRHVRLVQTYHGGGNRGDDDEAEYARRLLDTGRAVTAESIGIDNTLPDPDTDWLPREVTHVIYDGKAKRFRHYMPPPEGVES